MKANKTITFKRKLLYAAVASCFTVLPAYANPIGATVVNGSVSFATQNNTLTITNTPSAIINWQQFSIQSGEVTRFVQQSAQSAVLNRVVGQDPSQILGSLLSNGRVFLINPNGIVFGAGATVDVAGLVASTLRLSDGDFLAGRMNFTDGVGAGSIVNQGNITTPAGGNVYLIAPDILNSGIITSPQGEILLAAGHTVNLMDATNPDVQISLSAPATHAVNLGTLMAQSGKISLYASLIDQSGVINADTAVLGENGVIRLKASQDVTLEAGSSISARGGGTIEVLADMTNGQVNVDGILDASAPNGGDGGFIETSAAFINVANTARVTTLAANGKTGTWLIDPVDFTIAAGSAPQTISGIGATTLSTSLGSTNVSITTDPSTGGNGDIFVTSAVGWIAPTTLTLTAARNIDVNADIIATNTASGITLNAGGMVTIQPISASDVTVSTAGNIAVTAGGLTVQGGTATVTTNSTLTANAALLAGGNITLDVGAGGLSILGGSASADAYIIGMTAVAAANATVSAGGNLTITASGPVVVMGGVVDARASHDAYSTGVVTASATANALLSAGGTLTINQTAGSLTIQGGLGAGASALYKGINVASASANATVQANTLDITTTGALEVRGGDNARAKAGGGSPLTNNTATVEANAKLHAITDATITVGGNLTVAGGGNASASGSEAHGAQHITANVNAELSAGGNLTLALSGGSVSVLGGAGASANGTNSVSSAMATLTLNANALLKAGNLLTITASGLSVLGGGASASASAQRAVDVVTTHADATVQASTIMLTSGFLTVQGGNATVGARDISGASLSATANATLHASGNADITVSGDVHIYGGSNASASACCIFGTNQVLASANAELSAGGNLSLTLSGGNVVVRGGGGAFAHGSGSSAAANTTVTTSANALLSAGSLLTITGASGLSVLGGGASASASHEHTNIVTATADATVSAGTLTLAYGDLLVQGGSATAFASCNSTCGGNGIDTAIASASALLKANTVNVLSGSLTVQGGSASATSNPFVPGPVTATANTTATVQAGFLNVFGLVTLSSGSASASGPGAFAFANAVIQLSPPVSSLPDQVITAINFITGEINRSTPPNRSSPPITPPMNPPNGLIDGIRYGDQGYEDYGKPECS